MLFQVGLLRFVFFCCIFIVHQVSPTEAVVSMLIIQLNAFLNAIQAIEASDPKGNVVNRLGKGTQRAHA